MHLIFSVTLLICMALLFSGCDEGVEEGEAPNNQPANDWNGTFAQSKEFFIENVEGNATVLRVRDGNIPFTGRVTTHWPNGKQHVYRYREGKKHGLCTLRDKAGARTETNYLHGVEHGLHVQFGRDGKKRFEWRYVNGRLIE